MPGGNYYKKEIYKGYKNGTISLDDIKLCASRVIKMIVYSNVAKKVKAEDFNKLDS